MDDLCPQQNGFTSSYMASQSFFALNGALKGLFFDKTTGHLPPIPRPYGQIGTQNPRLGPNLAPCYLRLFKKDKTQTLGSEGISIGSSFPYSLLNAHPSQEWFDSYLRLTYGEDWSIPLSTPLRVGCGSFRPPDAPRERDGRAGSQDSLRYSMICQAGGSRRAQDGIKGLTKGFWPRRLLDMKPKFDWGSK